MKGVFKKISYGIATLSLSALLCCNYSLPSVHNHNPGLNSMLYASESLAPESELDKSHAFLEEEVQRFVERLKNNNGAENWKNLERIHYSATSNEEIGLAVILYKYKIPSCKDFAYLVVVNTDRLKDSDKNDRFQIISDIIISESLDDLVSKLEGCYKSLKDYSGAGISYRGTNIGQNLDLNEFKKHGSLYIGVACLDKTGGYTHWIDILSFEAIEEKLQNNEGGEK